MSGPFGVNRVNRVDSVDYFSLLEGEGIDKTNTSKEDTRTKNACSLFSAERDRENAENAGNAESPRVGRERIARALLDDFEQHGDINEVRVPGVPMTLFVVPSVSDVEALAGEGISWGRVWTARELVDLLRCTATVQDFAAVALVKVTLDADVVAVRPRR